MQEIKCLICNKIFFAYFCRKKQFCSRSCFYKSRIGHPVSEETRKRLSITHKGKSYHNKGFQKGHGSFWSAETRQKMSATMKMRGIRPPSPLGRILSEETKRKIGEGNWKGDNVGYVALHEWVYKNIGQPDTCKHCEKSDLKGKEIHWANKSGQYKRDLTDWLRLCAKCHYKYDGNRGFQKGYTPWNKGVRSSLANI